MLTQKQIKMLKLLDNQILSCKDCNLYKGGHCKPYWTKEYNGYFICGEAPGKNEVDKNEPFIGAAGGKLWDCMKQYGIAKEECFIINSANCRLVNGNKNGKPSEFHRDTCRKWIRKYFKILQPDKILLLGNFAMHTFVDEWGILKKYENNLFTNEVIFDKNVDVVRSVHPSMCIYRGEDGKNKLLKSIGLFKNE